MPNTATNSRGYVVMLLLCCVATTRADSPRVAPADRKQFSSNRHFYLLSKLKQQRTEVFKAAQSKTLLWSVPKYLSLPILSDDGQCIASVYDGGNILDENVRPSDPLITFYSASGQHDTVAVGDVVKDIHQLRKTSSGWAWGSAVGFQKSGFVVVLATGKSITLPACTRIGAAQIKR